MDRQSKVRILKFYNSISIVQFVIFAVSLWYFYGTRVWWIVVVFTGISLVKIVLMILKRNCEPEFLESSKS